MSDSVKIIQVKKLLIGLSGYLGQTIKDEQISMYAEDLEEYPLEEISNAIKTIRKQRVWNRFPLPAEILQYAPSYKGTTDEQADIIAGRIMRAVFKFGRENHEGARAWLGELAWEVFTGFGTKGGSWFTFCSESLVSEDGGDRARLKKHGVSVINRAKRKTSYAQLESDETKKRIMNMVKIRDIE